jgi:nitrogen fixation protein FixH
MKKIPGVHLSYMCVMAFVGLLYMDLMLFLYHCISSWSSVKAMTPYMAVFHFYKSTHAKAVSNGGII